MKKVTFALALMFGFVVCGMSQIVLAEGEEAMEIVDTEEDANVKSFNVYVEKWSNDNHYFSSGWMGDYGDIEIND